MMKSRWKPLTPALSVVMALLVLFAVPAQAENLENGGQAGKFRVEGLTTLVSGTNFKGTQSGPGEFLIHGKNAFIECFIGRTTEGEGISESEIRVTVLFESCETREDSGKFSKLLSCEIKEAGKEKGIGKGMITAKAIGKAKLHSVIEGELYILFVGSAGKPEEELFATVEFEGEECALGFKVKVTGSLVGRVNLGSLEALSHTIEFSKAITELFQVVSGGVTKGDKMKFGTAQALARGQFEAFPIESHLTCKWSVI